MENIYDIANQLERAIRQLPEYQAVTEKKALIDGDAEAKLLFEEFQVFQTKLYEQMQQGVMPTSEEQAKMQELGQKIEANDTLKAYLSAQQALSVYVADLERIIFKPLQDLMK